MIAPTMFSHGEREQLFKEKEIKLLKGATSWSFDKKIKKVNFVQIKDYS
jgi:hypothetical protein